MVKALELEPFQEWTLRVMSTVRKWLKKMIGKHGCRPSECIGHDFSYLVSVVLICRLPIMPLISELSLYQAGELIDDLGKAFFEKPWLSPFVQGTEVQSPYVSLSPFITLILTAPRRRGRNPKEQSVSTSIVCFRRL